MINFYVVATPIGNLSDISQRALSTLSCVDAILCEDTRVTTKLLAVFGIHTKTVSYHQHSDQSKTKYVIELLEAGKNLALVTDAGTPAISDPGGKLIKELVDHFGDDLHTIPIPGPCALTAALSIAGVNADEFVFLGFPPHKKGRQAFFERACAIETTAVIYESTHRIMKTLAEINTRIPDRRLVVCREITKLYETTYRGTASEVTTKLQSTNTKGEFVIIFSPL